MRKMNKKANKKHLQKTFKGRMKKISLRHAGLVVFVAIFATIGVYSLFQGEASRDPYVRPFKSTSVWNMPLHKNAKYVDSGYPYMSANGLDAAYFLKLKASDPLRDHILPGNWRDRCSGTVKTGNQLNLPNEFLIPDASQNADGSWKTPNNGWEFLLPDGETLYTSGAGARCNDTGPIHGHGGVRRVSIKGDGLLGGHGASRLPRLGGAIRKGEMTSSEPIRHALDIVLYTKYAYSDNKQTWESTFRWPASGADSYALDKTKTDRYIGTNPAMRIGSLLAIRPGVTPESLNVTSPTGRKLFKAFQDYGAYFTDDSAWNANYLTIEAGAESEMNWGTQQRQEFGRMIAALYVVDNNSPTTIGGGPNNEVGTTYRRAAQLPEIGSSDPDPTPPPTTPEDPPLEPEPEPYITPSEYLTKGVSVVASSTVGEPFTAEKVIDGNELENESRWTSARQDGETLTLNLGTVKTIEKVAYLFAGNTTKTYKIEISSNDTNYTQIATGETDNEHFTLREHSFNPVNAQYVRFTGLTRWNDNWGHSIREMAVYKSPTQQPDNPTPPPSTKVGDINGDGLVNLQDLSILLSNWGKSVAPNTSGDLNGDGVVNLADLSLLLSNWGK